MEFKEIVEEYHKMVYHISLEYLRNKDDAEDIVQEVFLKYVGHVLEEGKFTDKKHEKYWIIRVTINLCCNELKKLGRKKSIKLEENSMKKTYILQDNELFDEIEKLEEKYKSVFILHYLEDFKVSEISEILTISEDTVKTRLKRAREKLKNGLNEED